MATPTLLGLLLEQSRKHSVLPFYTFAQHYAQVMDSSDAPPPRLAGVGLIKEIMVTLDTGFVDDDLLQRANSGAAGWSTAEILRARADALLAADCPVKNRDAEPLLLKALDIANTQGALAWELRSATSLARLWQRQGRHRQAHELLAPIYQRFTEGHATPDLIAVRRLLGELQDHLPA
jgi:predicted ATPase